MALIALAVNDNWLKHASFAGFVTGKISDFAGVYYFPFLLTDLWWMLGARMISQERVMQIMVLVTATIMMGIKLSTPVRLFYTDILGLLGIHARVVPDATDLASLVMLPLALKRFRFLTRRFER